MEKTALQQVELSSFSSKSGRWWVLVAAVLAFVVLLWLGLRTMGKPATPPVEGMVPLASKVVEPRTISPPASRSLWTCPGPVHRILGDGRTLVAATEGGLLLRENDAWRLITREWGLPAHDFRDLAFFGGTWCGATARGLVRLNGRNTDLILLGPARDPWTTTCLLTDGNLLWVGTAHGPVAWDGKRAWRFPISSAGCDERVLDLVQAGTRRIVRLERGGLSEITSRGIVPLQGVPAGTVTALAGSDALWIGTAQGLYRWTDGGAIAVDPSTGGPSPAIVSLCSERGTTLAATFEGTIFEVSGNRLVSRCAGNGGMLSSVGLVEGSIWLGYANGLTNGAGDRIVVPGCLSANHVTAILPTPRGTLVGTFREGLVLLTGDDRVIPLGRDFPSGEVNALLEIGGRIWVATQRGIAVATRQGAESGDWEYRYPDLRCLTLSEREGEILIGTHRGLLRENKGRVALLGRDEGLPGETVFSLLWCGDTLWLGTSGGLARMVAGRPIETIRDPAIPSGWVTALVAVPQGFLGGMYGGGVFGRFEGEFRRLRRKGDINPQAAIATRQGALLGTANEGVLAWVGGEFVSLGYADGLPGLNVTAFAANGESLWVGTTTGLLRYPLAGDW